MSGRGPLSKPSRRELLLSILGTGVAARLLGGSAARQGLDRFGDAPVEALATLGEAWIGDHHQLSESTLDRELEARVGPGWRTAEDLTEWTERIVAAVEADFAAGATVAVEGWVIAETTARLGALAALALRGERTR